MEEKNFIKRVEDEYKRDKKAFLLNIFKISRLILIILFVLFPILLYWNHFGSFSLSNDFTQWINFSTYISGTLTPILAIINIFVLYQLTKTAKKIEQRNIASQLRKEEYVQIKKRLDELLEVSKDEKLSKKIKKDKAENLLMALESFLDDYNFLFPGLKDMTESEKLLDAIESFISTYNIETYVDAKSFFLNIIQTKFLLDTKTIIN